MIRFVSTSIYGLKFKGVVKGKVDQKDVSGALFRHSEQVYPKLAIVALQAKGRVGKVGVDVNYDSSKGKTMVALDIPFNGSRVQASVLSSVIETLEKVSFYEATFELRLVQEQGSDRSAAILQRAHQVYATAFPNKAIIDPVSKLQQLVSKSKYTINSDGFIMGATFKTSSEIILVEGKNDVQALATACINNTLGLGGLHYDAQKLSALLAGKSLTLMFDGNKGGLAVTDRVISEHGDKVRFKVRVKDGVDVEDLKDHQIRRYLEDKVRHK